jgi:hypothetical protein
MSVLWLYKIKAHTGTGICLEERCPNKGRYQVFLAGHRCDSAFAPELLCEKHGKEWADRIAELMLPEKAVTDALGAIRGTAAERIEAIDKLRLIGYSPDAIARAVKGVAERLPVEQLLEVLACERAEVAA